ncbi:hypothetical protein [Serratia fonticola]|nr:hypothetical protein [Serratia fonticola]
MDLTRSLRKQVFFGLEVSTAKIHRHFIATEILDNKKATVEGGLII